MVNYQSRAQVPAPCVGKAQRPPVLQVSPQAGVPYTLENPHKVTKPLATLTKNKRDVTNYQYQDSKMHIITVFMESKKIVRR